MKYKIINGQRVPVVEAKAKEIIKHKRSGRVYANKAEFDADVADTNTDTTADDFQQDVEILVDSLKVFGKAD